MRKLESLSLALATGVLLLGGAAASAQTPPSHTGTHPAGTTASDQTAGTTTTKTTTTTKDTAASSATESTKDSHFIKNAAEAGTTEVELGRLGADKAASSEVKQFAQHMLDDHSKANTELTSLASSKNVDIAKATEKARKSSEKLSDKAGADFDKAFMKKMVSDHKKVVRDFEREAKSGKDPDVKAFAEKSLPTLRQHLQEAENIYNGLKGTSTDTKGTRSTTKTSS